MTTLACSNFDCWRSVARRAPLGLSTPRLTKTARKRIRRPLVSAEVARPTPRSQIKALYAAFNERDAEGVSRLLAEDIVYEDLHRNPASLSLSLVRVGTVATAFLTRKFYPTKEPRRERERERQREGEALREFKNEDALSLSLSLSPLDARTHTCE